MDRGFDTMSGRAPPVTTILPQRQTHVPRALRTPRHVNQDGGATDYDSTITDVALVDVACSTQVAVNASTSNIRALRIKTDHTLFRKPLGLIAEKFAADRPRIKMSLVDCESETRGAQGTHGCSPDLQTTPLEDLFNATTLSPLPWSSSIQNTTRAPWPCECDLTYSPQRSGSTSSPHECARSHSAIEPRSTQAWPSIEHVQHDDQGPRRDGRLRKSTEQLTRKMSRSRRRWIDHAKEKEWAGRMDEGVWAKDESRCVVM